MTNPENPIALQYRPIKSFPQYKSYESYLEKLLWIKNRTELEQADAELLISLISEWDRNNGSTSSVLPKTPISDPVKILESLMKERSLSAGALASQLGISQSLMSDLLNYRSELSEEMIGKICGHFEISPQAFGQTGR